MEKESTKKQNQKAIKDMELQIHKQFSENYNSSFSSTVTLFCTMLATLYAYGYMFLETSSKFSTDFYILKDDGGYTLDALVFTTIATYAVLTIMKYICLSQGVSIRLEQFVVHAIRTKYYGVNPTTIDMHKIFPKSYHPFKKGKNEMVVGIYGEFIKIIRGLQVLTIVGLLYKLCWNVISYDIINTNAVFELFVLAIIIVISYGQYNSAEQTLYKKYSERAEEYEMTDTGITNKNKTINHETTFE